MVCTLKGLIFVALYLAVIASAFEQLSDSFHSGSSSSSGSSVSNECAKLECKEIQKTRFFLKGRFEKLAENIYENQAIMVGMASETIINGKSHFISFSHHYDVKNAEILWEISKASAVELADLANKPIKWGPYTVSL